MSIEYYCSSKEFHLFNGKICYMMKILDNGQLGHLYFGKKLKERPDFGHMAEYAYRDMAPCEFDGNVTFSMEHLCQEYPCYASADARYTAFDVEDSDTGNRVHRFLYASHEIIDGKREIKGLPHTYTEDSAEAQTLEITLKEEKQELFMVLSYTIYETFPVIVRHTRFINKGRTSVILHSAMSMCLDLPDKEYRMIELAGAWGRERYVRERQLDYGVQGIYSMRGSSHQFNPFLAFKRPQTTEGEGEVIGVSLIYSGNFLAQADVDNYEVTRILMGIHPNGFDWELEPGEEFQTPEAVVVYSDSGLNGMSRAFHTLYRTRLAKGYWRDRRRPVLLNNWEATYFDFSEEKLLQLASEAKELGIELFVLDDGWFGRRNGITSSLGDWYPNLEKLPGGIRGLSEKIREIGLAFGLWVEPEMVNEDSCLYKEHPDWLLSSSDRHRCKGRHQLVLDFSKKEVRDYLFGCLEKVFEEGRVSYVKWDMNRSISEAFGNGKNREWQGKLLHLHMLGVYELYERLNRRFPKILFESCASGGGRFDPGMLYYAPQGWISDNTDAVERLKIQYGTSFVYPVSSMGSHVSAVPNHQVFRVTPMRTRADVAYFGTFGYELDVQELSEDDKEELKKQIIFRKNHWRLFQSGDFYRLKSPFEGNVTAWMVVSEDQEEAIVGYYRVLQPANIGFQKLKLQGLNARFCYYVDGIPERYFGDELMESGLIVSDFASGILGKDEKIQGDYLSKLFHIHVCEEPKE